MKSYDIGYHLLGPLFYQYNYRLWQKQQYYESIDGAALYMARGGLRMRYFYNQFMIANNNTHTIPQVDFWCSRMAAFKAAMLYNPGPFLGYIQGEYGGHNILNAMQIFLGDTVFKNWKEEKEKSELKRYQNTKVNIEDLTNIFVRQSSSLEVIQNYFYIQKSYLKEHIDDCLQGKKVGLIIDTGWSGSIIQALTTALPLNPIFAAYFGRYDYQGRWLPWFFHIQGLGLEKTGYMPRNPETSIYLHRHLIEGPCEVRCPSTTEYTRDKNSGKVTPKNVTMFEEQRAPNESEPIALGIVDYQKDAIDKMNVLDINKSAQKASKRLHELIVFPKPSEVQNATPKGRSKDFGTDMIIPVLVPKAKKGKDKFTNIDRDLWPLGQIAIEYPYFTRLFQKMWILREKKGILGFIGRLFYSMAKKVKG